MAHATNNLDGTHGLAAGSPEPSAVGLPVRLYTTPTDSRSARTKAWLNARGIPFTDYNVVADPEALRQMIEVSGARRVPVVQIGDQVLVGFDEDQLAANLPGWAGNVHPTGIQTPLRS